jgi:hypothetical protein
LISYTICRSHHNRDLQPTLHAMYASASMHILQARGDCLVVVGLAKCCPICMEEPDL